VLLVVLSDVLLPDVFEVVVAWELFVLVELVFEVEVVLDVDVPEDVVVEFDVPELLEVFDEVVCVIVEDTLLASYSSKRL
jgi:hypothetical protein